MPNDACDPRVYVACLSCYVQGRLHGSWFAVGTDADDLSHEVLGFFAAGCETCSEYEPECPECRAFAAPFPCGGEELAVHDHEGLGRLDESYDPERLCAVVSLIEEFPERPALAYLDHVDGDLEQARLGLTDNYSGGWDSRAEWAESYAEDAGYGIGQLWAYVDWDAVARDMCLNGDVTTLRSGGALHVFVG